MFSRLYLCCHEEIDRKKFEQFVVSSFLKLVSTEQVAVGTFSFWSVDLFCGGKCQLGIRGSWRKSQELSERRWDSYLRLGKWTS